MVNTTNTIRSLLEAIGNRYENLVITPLENAVSKRISSLVLFDDASRYALDFKNLSTLALGEHFWFAENDSWQDDIQWFRARLIRELSNTRYASCTISRQSWRAKRADYRGDEHWVYLLLGLLRQLECWKIKLDSGRLIQILQLAESDAKTSYQLLAAAFQWALAQRIGRLERRVHFLGRLLALFYGIQRISFSLRNLISSQRCWFLYHGAHPSDSNSPRTQGCFSRVCFQPI
jgi:hypothetical protein